VFECLTIKALGKSPVLKYVVQRWREKKRCRGVVPSCGEKKVGVLGGFVRGVGELIQV
jgi:hypothetical protein